MKDAVNAKDEYERNKAMTVHRMTLQITSTIRTQICDSIEMDLNTEVTGQFLALTLGSIPVLSSRSSIPVHSSRSEKKKKEYKKEEGNLKKKKPPPPPPSSPSSPSSPLNKSD